MDPESGDLSSEALLLVGRVGRAHGIRGQVVVNPETDFMEDRFKVGQILRVGPADRTRPYEIRGVRFYQGRPIVQFAGIETMNDAEALAGAEVWLPASSIEPLPPETFYRHDLVGCEVRRLSGDAVGRVTAVEGTLERSHLVVDADGRDTLIPLAAPICVRIDLAARVIVVDPPEGLLEVNAPGRQD